VLSFEMAVETGWWWK